MRMSVDLSVLRLANNVRGKYNAIKGAFDSTDEVEDGLLMVTAVPARTWVEPIGTLKQNLIQVTEETLPESATIQVPASRNY